MRRFNPLAKGGARLLLAFFVPLLLLHGCDGIQEDELECEQALAHLHECCVKRDFSEISCRTTAGCGSTTYPTYPTVVAVCIQEKSCAELAAEGICDRAFSAEPRVAPADGGGDLSANDEVCR